MLRLVFLLLGFVALLTQSSPTSSRSEFTIPKVKVEVFQPKGFRISMPHVNGIQMFAFHGSINRPMRNVEVGDYYKDVMYPTNGQWVYEEKNAKLRIGDRLYYWVYLLHNRLGYKRDDQVYRVTEFSQPISTEYNPYDPPPCDTYDALGFKIGPSKKPIDSNFLQSSPQSPQSPQLPQSPPSPPSLPSLPPPLTDCLICNTSLTSCERSVIKITEKLIDTELKVQEVLKTNVLLKSIIDELPGGKKLTLTGRLSQEDDPFSVVKFILNEKLDLRPRITSAKRNADNSISFELFTVDEVVEVVSQAREKLKDSTTVSINYDKQ